MQQSLVRRDVVVNELGSQVSVAFACASTSPHAASNSSTSRISHVATPPTARVLFLPDGLSSDGNVVALFASDTQCGSHRRNVADDGDILAGRCGKHVSETIRCEMDTLQVIGGMACTLLHGDVVIDVAKRLRCDRRNFRNRELAEISGRVIISLWRTTDASGMLRENYDELVEMLGETMFEACGGASV